MEGLKTLITAPFKALKWLSDKVGPVVTLGGLILFPFFLTSAAHAAAAGMIAKGAVAANGAAAGTAATAAATTTTNGQILTSFWSNLYTNPAGQAGITPFFQNMANGASVLTKSFMSVAKSIGGPMPLTQGLSTALGAPAVL
jgi:hypothetical protein